MYVLSNPFWYFVLFCSVFYCYFDFSKQHFTKDNNEKKSHGRRNETTLYLRLKTCRKFPQKREHQTSTSLRARRARSLFWGSREKSARVRWRDCERRSERRVLSRLALLSSRLNFNSCLARYSSSTLPKPIAFRDRSIVMSPSLLFSGPITNLVPSFRGDLELGSKWISLQQQQQQQKK